MDQEEKQEHAATVRSQYRKGMLDYCLWLLERAGSQYAMHAADWYEAQDRDWLVGLGQRIRNEVAKRRVAMKEAADAPL